MSDHLIVGRSPNELEVVMNIPAIPQDATGWMHITFTPDQAIALGQKLIKHARECRQPGRTFDATAEPVSQAPTRVWIDGGYLGNGHCPWMLAKNGACCCLPYRHTGECKLDGENDFMCTIHKYRGGVPCPTCAHEKHYAGN